VTVVAFGPTPTEPATVEILLDVVRSIAAFSAPSVNALNLSAIASCFSSTPAVSASISFLNCSEPANAFGASLASLRTSASVLQRLDSVNNGLDLALGIREHVVDIRHMQLPAHSLPLDVQQRLDWYKQRAAPKFERSIKSDVNTHNITSPIEQIFLMEWRLLEVDSQHRVKIRPQHELMLDGRNHRIDFIVDVPDGGQIAIELDGHDFTNERKSRRQMIARERTIVRHGYIIHRFTGSEVHRNPRKCVEEVIQLITLPAR
jgi:very-short-patch-repair endonuclease